MTNHTKKPEKPKPEPCPLCGTPMQRRGPFAKCPRCTYCDGCVE